MITKNIRTVIIELIIKVKLKLKKYMHKKLIYI
jgi:hypothetical protein